MKKPLMAIGVVIAAAVIILFGLNMATGAIGRKTMETVMEKATGDKADVQMNADGTMNIKTKDGEFTTGNSVPKDWPADAPVYEGATVQYAGSGTPTGGNAGQAIVMVTSDSVATVTAYYTQSLTTNGWTLGQTMSAGSATMLSATKDTRTLSLMISESDGQTGITLAVETK